MHFHVITGSPRAPVCTRAQLQTSPEQGRLSLVSPWFSLFLPVRFRLLLSLTSDFARLPLVLLYSLLHTIRVLRPFAMLSLGLVSLYFYFLFIGLIVL